MGRPDTGVRRKRPHRVNLVAGREGLAHPQPDKLALAEIELARFSFGPRIRIDFDDPVFAVHELLCRIPLGHDILHAGIQALHIDRRRFAVRELARAAEAVFLVIAALRRLLQRLADRAAAEPDSLRL
jgi:hypothetical protein